MNFKALLFLYMYVYTYAQNKHAPELYTCTHQESRVLSWSNVYQCSMLKAMLTYCKATFLCTQETYANQNGPLDKFM